MSIFDLDYENAINYDKEIYSKTLGNLGLTQEQIRSVRVAVQEAQQSITVKYTVE